MHIDKVYKEVNALRCQHRGIYKANNSSYMNIRTSVHGPKKVDMKLGRNSNITDPYVEPRKTSSIQGT